MVVGSILMAGIWLCYFFELCDYGCLPCSTWIYVGHEHRWTCSWDLTNRKNPTKDVYPDIRRHCFLNFEIKKSLYIWWSYIYIVIYSIQFWSFPFWTTRTPRATSCLLYPPKRELSTINNIPPFTGFSRHRLHKFVVRWWFRNRGSTHQLSGANGSWPSHY